MFESIVTFMLGVTVTAEEIGLPRGTSNVGQIISRTTMLLMILVGSLSLIFLLGGGLQMALSNGDPKKVKQAKDTITYAVVGIIVSIAALAIVSFVASSLK